MRKRFVPSTLSPLPFALSIVGALFFALSSVGAMLIALCFPAEAQQVKKVYRIGVLQRSTLPASFLEAFRRGLRELGYVEGQNIVIENRATDEGRSAASAAELVRLGVDVIVATGTGAVRDAKKATTTIPIVMSPSADAVAAGLVRASPVREETLQA